MRGWPTPLSLTNACIDGSRMEIRPDMSAESLYRQTHPYERLWSIIYKAKQISRQIRHCGSIITSHLLYECQHGRRLWGTVPKKFEMGTAQWAHACVPQYLENTIDQTFYISSAAERLCHCICSRQCVLCTFHVQR